MPYIRPVSDLRNNFADISRIVQKTSQPIFLTKNGYGSMVVMSMEAYEQMQEAKHKTKTTTKRHSHKEVFDELRTSLTNRTGSDAIQDSVSSRFRKDILAN